MFNRMQIAVLMGVVLGIGTPHCGDDATDAQDRGGRRRL